MLILQIVFLLSVCGCSQAHNLTITDILEIAKLSRDVTIDLFKTFKLLDNDIGLSPNVKGQKALFKEMKVINNKIGMLNEEMGRGSSILYGMVSSPYIDYDLIVKLLDVAENIRVIKLKYEDMGTFIETSTAYEDLTLEEFARSIVSHNNSSQSLLDGIHAIIGVVNVYKILIDLMTEEGNGMFCAYQMSAQQLLLYLYNTLALTELKGFLMLEFSYMLLKLHNQGNFTKEIEAAHERYKDRSEITLKLTIEALTWVPYEIWRCDPRKQVKNETYIEITELLQGYIENEEDLSDQRSCYLKCHAYTKAESYKCYNYQDRHMFCDKNRQCKGKIINCQYMANAVVMFADAGTNRRYEYINQEGKRLGRYKDCGYNYASFKSWGSWISSCDYCMCLCDEQSVNSDRFFSLRSSESDTHHNMVVTGLRFVKKNRIIHLQIQQGKLLPRAKIDMGTVNWKPVENYTIDDPGVRDGEHYHTLTWDKRNFDLDDLILDQDELVTGVRFRMIGSHLNFQIRVTPFNFTTGTLEFWKNIWWRNKISQKDRKKVNLDNKDIPIKATDRSLPLTQNDMYLEFTPTDLYMDVAQTTVPFIDAQAVASNKLVPLSGAGVMYKGSNNFGGFIYPMIRTYDYLELLLNADDDTNFSKKFDNMSIYEDF